jgi:serine/threonine-protein kinase
MVDLRDFAAELKRRRVIRALLGWGIASFAVLQVVEPIMHALSLPEWTLKVVVCVLAAGFPATAGLSWAFDLKAGGIERTPSAGERADPSTGSGPRRTRLALLLVGLGALAAAPGLVYFFVWPGAGRGPTGGSSAPAVAADPSIAVLPLVNLSSDREQEYFSDGLTEELLNLLAKVPGLHVAARTSAFAFKGKNEDLRTIGQKLNVAHVLEGSVRRSGDQLRITTQLISVSDGYHLWSETYDRKITDVFAVQDEIATAVVAALELKLLQTPAATGRRPVGAEAHDLYLRGLYFWNLRTADSLLRAAGFFQQAIEAAPDYALAHAGLADAMEVRRGYAWVPWTEKLRDQARAAALRALELDPGLGEAHASLGMILFDDLDNAGAVDQYRRAIALRPEYATARHWYAIVLAHLGRLDEAAREIARAIELEPTSRIISANGGWIALAAGDPALAEQRYRSALELAPGFGTALYNLAVLYALQGRKDEALAEIAKIPPEEESRPERATVYALAGRRQEAERLASELQALSEKQYVPGAILAGVWTAVGDRDKAIAALRRVCRERDGAWLEPVKVHPMYQGLRSDPRFDELLDCLHAR